MDDLESEARGQLEDVRDRVQTITVNVTDQSAATFRILTFEGRRLVVILKANEGFFVTEEDGAVKTFDSLNTALLHCSVGYGQRFFGDLGAKLAAIDPEDRITGADRPQPPATPEHDPFGPCTALCRHTHAASATH